jgi:hypothetical protein
MEAHDTTPDADRVEKRRRIVLRSREPREARPSEAGEARPVRLGAPIPEDEALAAAPLSRVRVREALVKLQRSGADAAPRRPCPQKGETISFVRSGDTAQRIGRRGRDAFHIVGIAAGDGVLSVAVDASIFSVRLEKGDDARRTLARVDARLGPAYRTEVVEAQGDSIVARVVLRA